MFERILIAIDQSEIGELAFTTGLSLAKTMGSRLMLVHAVSPAALSSISPVYSVPDPVYSTSYAAAMSDYKQALDAIEESASHLLEGFQKRATDAGIIVEVSRPIGEPAHAICQIADRWKADLIVIGRHHHSKVGELFWGSVSNFVVHHANSFVLLAQEKPD